MARAEIEVIVEQLKAASAKYYTTGQTLMDDPEYNALLDKLELLDPNNPYLDVIGADNIPDNEKVDVGYKMYSTDKSLTPEELQPYWNRTAGNHTYIYSQKVDGMAVDLTYEDGRLVRASTRGNGQVGKVFTSKMKYIKDSEIPKFVKRGDVLFTGKVRGEMFLTYENFDQFNEILEAEGKELQDNCRNSAAGLINAGLENMTQPEKKVSLLSFRAYGVYDEEDPETDEFGSYETYHQQLEMAKTLGFTPVEYGFFTQPKDFTDKLEDLKKWLQDFNFPNDGIVIRVDDQALARPMGVAKKYLNAVTAFKFLPAEALVVVKEIEWQQGSREFTPVVVFDPVDLDGAEVRRAGGHSVKNLIDLDAVPGRTILIRRSGGVIPRAYHRSCAISAV